MLFLWFVTGLICKMKNLSVTILSCLCIFQYVPKLTSSIMHELDKLLGNRPSISRRDNVSRWLASQSSHEHLEGTGTSYSESHPSTQRKGSLVPYNTACSLQWHCIDVMYIWYFHLWKMCHLTVMCYWLLIEQFYQSITSGCRCSFLCVLCSWLHEHMLLITSIWLVTRLCWRHLICYSRFDANIRLVTHL